MSNEFKLVPIEPTPEMLRAGLASNGIVPVYTAMLAAAPQPPALGGEPESKLIKLAAELSSRRPIRSLQDLCDRQKSVSTAKLIEDVEMCGDFLAAIAIDIRHCVEASRAHLAPLQAENKRLELMVAQYDHDTDHLYRERDQLKARNAELERLLQLSVLAVEDMVQVHSDQGDALSEQACIDLASAIRGTVYKPAGSDTSLAEFGPEHIWTCGTCKIEQPTDRACDVCNGPTKPAGSGQV